MLAAAPGFRPLTVNPHCRASVSCTLPFRDGSATGSYGKARRTQRRAAGWVVPGNLGPMAGPGERAAQRSSAKSVLLSSDINHALIWLSTVPGHGDQGQGYAL
jgi:hypothetical protein